MPVKRPESLIRETGVGKASKWEKLVGDSPHVRWND
jgi:hypothetical protein